MTYTEWFDDFANKHQKIVQKLLSQGLDKKEIIEYFDFENMVQKENDFCLLYAENKKCHDMESLNCYLCACPYFRFDDEGVEKVEDKTKYSFCDINSKDGHIGTFGETMHQDCSLCRVPHHRSYIDKNFDLDWKKIMLKCNLG